MKRKYMGLVVDEAVKEVPAFHKMGEIDNYFKTYKPEPSKRYKQFSFTYQESGISLA